MYPKPDPTVRPRVKWGLRNAENCRRVKYGFGMIPNPNLNSNPNPNLTIILQLKGSVKEPNISVYFFFRPSYNGVLFPMFCLLVEGSVRF